ncbi:serine/threonine-protein kinase ATR-like [Lutzomyia longipalpis]|uniref:serine/threonine-protein kinase ATR-like n=1 Tax=Lutzomyia longipalpis TaxID=7200 RepID=UPI002483B4CD|nr:serine/threonine-protein kinase ATR-like [Lutzomyia longipalpis]
MAQYSDIYLEMWRTLFDTLTKPLEKRADNELRAIFGMIRDRLVFECPGFFPKEILDAAEKDRVEACNFWLIQKLFHLLVEEQYSRFDDDILGLLRDFLAGCIVKQRWLFTKIVRKYVEIVRGLISLKDQEKLEIDHFNTSRFDLTTIDPNMQCTSVIVPAGSIARKILDTIVQILASILCVIGQTDPKLIQEASESVYEVLDRGHLASKLRAFEYFKEVFRNAASPLSTSLKAQQLGLLIAIEAVLRNLAFWLSMEKFMTLHLQSIQQTLPEICEAFKELVQAATKQDCEILLKAVLPIIGTLHTMHEVLFDKLRPVSTAFITYGAELITHASLELEEKTKKEILTIIPQNMEALKLLEVAIAQEVEKNPEGDSIQAKSKTWQEISSLLRKKTPEKENFYSFLLLFGEVIRMGGRISRKTSTKCFGSEINEMIVLLWKAVEWSVEFDFQDVNLLLLIAQEFTFLTDFKNSTEVRQAFILELILCPLSKITRREWKNLPKNIANVISSKQSVPKDQLEVEFISLRTLFSMQEGNVSPKILLEVKNVLLEILQQHQSLNFDSQVCLFPLIVTALAKKLLQMTEVYKIFYSKTLQEEKFHSYISQSLMHLICVLSGNISPEMCERGSFKFTCKTCQDYTENSPAGSNPGSQELLDPFLKLFVSSKKEVIFNMIECIRPLLAHFPHTLVNLSLWTPLLEQEDCSNREKFAYTLPLIINNIFKLIPDEEKREKILREAQEIVLKVIIRGVRKKDTFKNHYSVLLLLDKFSECPKFTEDTFIHCFKMVFFFIINTESVVAYEASILGRDMCIRRGVTPMNMFFWYKEDILRIIISLSVGIFLRNNVGLYNSLTHTAKFLGYTAAREFITSHYKIILAMLLPWIIKYHQCEKLLEDVCEHTGQELSDALSESFVTIYSYLFLNQSPEINNKCIDYVMKNTSQTLYCLLHTDIKKTIPEVLQYYHKNPQFVMHAFQNLLSKNEVTLEGVATYISSRFLGILTYFENLIINRDMEKALKREALLSLGDIVRFMGPQHITPYRFKVLTVLKTALTVDDISLKKIMASVWTIFLHTVDVQCLGPLLSTIVVSLEPLLEHLPEQVGEIFHYLIVENRNLLNSHFGDLFFIENTKLEDSIKAIVSSQVSQGKATRHNFREKFENFRTHINHENLGVKTYGLIFLRSFFGENRTDLNRMVFDQVGIDAILVGCLETIMQGCRHVDENLQVAAGMCLGELGALEPSHLPPNYAPQKTYALSIHSDEFAIMALAELCRAYQLQKNSRYVDSLSLAIQEILNARGVAPDEGKKLTVWHAIPERMRQLMQPLLTSCYTAIIPNTNTQIHPVFGSSKCHSLEEWTFIWASNMIQHIQDNSTKHILNSFRPSIKHDMQALSMFLPYVILHTLQSCKDEYRTKIAEEFKQVFATAASMNGAMDVPKIVKRCRGIRSIGFMPSSTTDEQETKEEVQQKCAKMAFNQLDFIEIWLQQYHTVYENPTNNAQYMLVRGFIDQFDRKILATGNFNVGEYARSLQYMEEYLLKHPAKLQEELGFLAKIHAELMDPDSVEGAMRLMNQSLPLPEQIVLNSITGRLSESAVCFEKLMQEGNITPSLTNSLVQYYLALDQPETALLVSEGLLNQFQDYNVDKLTLELRAEPLWQMGRFEDLDDLIKNSQLEDSDGWGVRCGSLLLSYQRDDHDNFASEMQRARLSILKSLRSAEIEQNTYQKGYSDVLKLHMVTEIEKAFEMMQKITENSSEEQVKHAMKRFFSDWDARLQLLQPSTRTMEPLLRLRRVLLMQGKTMALQHCKRNPLVKRLVETKMTNELGKMWLKSAELARKEGLHQQAQLYLLNLETFQMKDLFLERAKFLWARGDHASTFQTLERGLEDLLKAARVDSAQSLPQNDRILYAEGKFLIATFNAESMNIQTDLNINYFREAIAALASCEKSHVHYAQFLDKLYNALPEEQQIAAKGTELLKEIMLSYGKSLQFGCNYLYQSMPRLLSIWLDYAALPAGCDKRVSRHMTDLALRLSNTLPSYMFFIAFSQLVSRICHPAQEVYQVLKTILIKLIVDYPQQSLWMILSVLKSSYASRSKRCIEMLNDQRLKDQEMQVLINNFNRLAEKLIELTNKNIPNHVRDPKVSNLVPQLPQLFKNPTFSQIVIPAQKFMQPELPTASERNAATTAHNAFPRQMFYIRSIKNDIVILRSLQRPRKVVFVANDGLEYSVLMKPKDDLRKDFRLMEFNAVVKQYLRQDPDARQRRLHIRTYSVLPLNEECGIIEWVSNLTTLRSIVLTLYRRHGMYTDMNDIKKIEMAREREGKSGKKDIFVNILCKRHPPILGEWFRTTFTTPFNWYQARSSYIRTTAVMSIVGYILGLGDRHGENILFDHTNGDTVHVDFNCLFNKGESLGVPEVVPFRLTHNMVHAMGPLGVEGLFRKCCEVTLHVLQAQTSTLMSVLRPFVYDPLVSWNKKEKERVDSTRERTDPQALTNLNHIEERLKGYVKINGKRVKIPLSTEGQVNFVIKEATDVENLSAMYIGWGAYM